MRMYRKYLQRKDNRSLDEFPGWGSGGEDNDVDFFAQTASPEEDNTDAKTIIEKITEEDKEIDKDKTSEEKKEEDLFGKQNNDDNSGSEEEEEEESVDSPNIFILNKLKEKGFIEYELEEGEELTDELAEELLEEKFDESVDNKVAELMSEIPDDAKQVINYLIKGGNLGELLGTITAGSTEIDVNADLDKEDTQLSVMKKLLKLEDKDDEEIDAELEYLKDSGKLKTMAEKKLAKYKKEVDARQQEVLQSQENKKQKEKELIREAKGKLTTFLTENQEVNGIHFNKDDKKLLPSYMNDKSVKLDNGTTITQMQKDLFYEIPKNQKALIQLAALLRNRNQDGTFNFESIAKETETKVTRQVKDNLRRNRTSIPGNSTSKGKESNRTLADFFEN